MGRSTRYDQGRRSASPAFGGPRPAPRLRGRAVCYSVRASTAAVPRAMSPDTPSVSPDFEKLLEYLKDWRGFDFTAYKRTTLARRVDKRLAATGVSTYTE